VTGRLRYLLLSPSRDLRQSFLGTVFGSFEVSPQALGERVVFTLPAGDLEVVGTGAPGRLASAAKRFLDRGAELDGILLLLPSGDQDGWDEGRALREFLAETAPRLAFRAFVLDPSWPLEKKGVKGMLLALVSEQERLLGGAP